MVKNLINTKYNYTFLCFFIQANNKYMTSNMHKCCWVGTLYILVRSDNLVKSDLFAIESV